MKKLLRDGLRKLGWDVQPYRTFRGLPDPEPQWETDADFLRLYHQAVPFTLLDRRRLYMLFQLARHARELPGHFAECGVYRGGSARLLSELKGPQQELLLFDTFAGMPETDHTKDHHRANDFADTSVSGVEKTLAGQRGVHFHAGFFPETTQGLEDRRFALAHVDFDIYQSMKDACHFFYPRLVRGGCIVFDDFGAPSCPGAKAAVLEFCAAQKTHPLYLPTGQALLYNFWSTL